MKIFVSDYGNGIAAELAAGTALALALHYQKRVLLLNDQLAGSGVDCGFNILKIAGSWRDDTFSSIPEFGIDALLRLASIHRLTKENFADYTVPIIPGYLDLASGTNSSKHDKPIESCHTSMNSLYSVAEEAYDIVIKNRSRCSGTTSCLSTCVPGCYGEPEGLDIELIVVDQKRSMLEKVLKEQLEKRPAICERRMRQSMVVISDYDDRAKWNINNIKRKYDCKVPIYGIPYDTGFSDSWNDKDIVRFFRRGLLLPRQVHRRDSLLFGVMQVVHALLKMMEQAMASSSSTASSSDVKGA